MHQSSAPQIASACDVLRHTVRPSGRQLAMLTGIMAGMAIALVLVSGHRRIDGFSSYFLLHFRRFNMAAEKAAKGTIVPMSDGRTVRFVERNKLAKEIILGVSGLATGVRFDLRKGQ